LLNDHANRFAYQVMGGAAVRLSPTVSLTAQYRWFSAGDLHFHDLGANRPVTRHHAGHNIDIGIRVRL
jgi:opacity protein-like surface antigen